MIDRRNFIKKMAAAGLVSSMPSTLLPKETSSLFHQDSTKKKEMIWASLLHISYNMWHDHAEVVWDDLPADTYSADDYIPKTCMDSRRWARGYRSFLTFDDDTWNAILQHMVDSGMNMVVMDLGDAIKYNSHPEIAVKNAWSTDRLKAELTKMRKMGLEPIPKLNFASAHHAWLGEYSRMIATKQYYTVCKNLINEVCDLFDNPRFFHLGMDEEITTHQKDYNYLVVRQRDLWWHDFYLLTEEVEKNNVRPWVWSDYAWHNLEIFFKKMPKSVLQSNWYYKERFDVENMGGNALKTVMLYNELDKAGYDQVPTGSNHQTPLSIDATVNYCKKELSSTHLYGFMTAPWRPTLPLCLDRHKEAIDQVGNAIKKFY